MKIIFTHHSKKRMGLRKITLPMIEQALLYPDTVGYGYFDRNINYKRYENGIIKVVYTKEKGCYIIISVIWHTKK